MAVTRGVRSSKKIREFFFGIADGFREKCGIFAEPRTRFEKVPDFLQNCGQVLMGLSDKVLKINSVHICRIAFVFLRDSIRFQERNDENACLKLNSFVTVSKHRAALYP